MKEVTLEEREQFTKGGVFDINGNIPFHPGYIGIHQLADGRFVERSRQDYGSPEWIDGQREITDADDIRTLERYINGELDGELDGEPPEDKGPDTTHTDPCRPRRSVWSWVCGCWRCLTQIPQNRSGKR